MAGSGRSRTVRVMSAIEGKIYIQRPAAGHMANGKMPSCGRPKTSATRSAFEGKADHAGQVGTDAIDPNPKLITSAEALGCGPSSPSFDAIRPPIDLSDAHFDRHREAAVAGIARRRRERDTCHAGGKTGGDVGRRLHVYSVELSIRCDVGNERE